MGCVWRLFIWSRPYGRAFEMTMCALKAKKLRQKVEVDFELCRISCGDGVMKNIAEVHFV